MQTQPTTLSRGPDPMPDLDSLTVTISDAALAAGVSALELALLRRGDRVDRAVLRPIVLALLATVARPGRIAPALVVARATLQQQFRLAVGELLPEIVADHTAAAILNAAHKASRPRLASEENAHVEHRTR